MTAQCLGLMPGPAGIQYHTSTSLMQVCYKGSIMAHEVYCFAAWHAAAALALSSGSCQTAYCKADGHMAVIALLPHGSTSNSIAALFLMLLHLIAGQACALCMDACFYSSMFACVGRQTLHACHSEVIEAHAEMLQLMQAACSVCAPL